MKFDVIGNRNDPVVIMLTGSFCPGECLEYLYSKLDGKYIIVPTYNGHYAGSKEFTTRALEAKEIKEYLVTNKITVVQMIYGQSMGAEIGMELCKQLLESGIQVQHQFYDGAPMIRLSSAYKAFMKFKFTTMMNWFKNKTVDDVMNMKLIKNIVGDKAESLRPMMEAVAMSAPYMTKTTIKNETECCYTFDFPKISEEVEKHTTFFYGDEEKAYKTCYKLVKNAYPNAMFKVIPGQGHVTYSCEHTDEYIELLKECMEK